MTPPINFRIENCPEPSEQEIIETLISNLKITNLVSTLKEIEVAVFSENYFHHTPTDAHCRTWRREHLPNVKAPEGFPSVPLDEIFQVNCKAVEVLLIEKRNPGMGSYYGFSGWFLSLIVDFDAEKILDCKGEKAS